MQSKITPRKAVVYFEKELAKSIIGHLAHGRTLEPEEERYFQSAIVVVELARSSLSKKSSKKLLL